MPQMKPLSWFCVFIMIVGLLLLTKESLYFFKGSFKLIPNKISGKNKFWKW